MPFGRVAFHGLRSTKRRRRPAGGLAALLAVVLVFNLGGSGIEGLPTAANRDGQHHTPAPKPGQRWGSAAGQEHLTGKPGNHTVPPSLRGQYPIQQLDQRPRPARNVASVAAPPATKARGFDRATSRELPSGRGARERVYQNADGTQTTEFSPVATNYKRPDGSWAPIDSRLLPVDGADAGWRNAADAVDLRLAARADAPELARLALGEGNAFGYGLEGAAPVAGTLDGGTVTYPSVLPEVDLRIEGRAGGLKETLVLRSPDAPNRYVFPLRLKGLAASVVGGQVVLTDGAGARRAVIPAGYMLDSTPDAPATSTGVRYRIVERGGQPALEVTADREWLRDPARRYPVLIDPTVGPPVADGSADASKYVQGNQAVTGGAELRVGRFEEGNAASYIRFDGLVDRLRNHTVYGAALVVANYDSPTCRPRPMTVHPVTADWGSSNSFPGPAVGAALGSKSFAHGYIAFGQSQSACPAAAEMIDLGAGGRSLVQRWVNGQQANHGLSLRASTSDTSAWKRIAGTTTANGPKLYVTHTPYNAKYAIPKPTPEPPVLQNQDGKVKVTVTNLGAETWTPSTYYLAYRAYNAQTGTAVTQQRSANLTGNLARGASVTLDANIKSMAPGTYFLDFTMVRTGGAVFTDHQVPPGRIVLQVFDIPPVVQEVYPPNGYQAETLTPLLWARAIDTDAPPGATLQFKFEVCDRNDAGAPVNCTSSAYQTKQAWTVPAGRLSWSKTYLWRAFVKDANNEVASPQMALLASVPQPAITSRIASAPNATRERDFDAQVGNVTISAVDAAVANVGPELSVTRTYNSLDPRTDLAFGAGWMTRYDMRLVPDDDGSGNVVVNYPDGQTVRYGRNPDGTYAAPAGRTAQLTVDGTAWRLLDRSGTTYQFALTGKLVRITDNASHSLVYTYGTDGKLSRVQVANSLTNTAGRALRFTWSGSHVSAVTTDAVNGVAQTWNYTYTGDLLTQVCGPDTDCTRYEYTSGSHYRGAVVDSRPESYWRLGEPAGSAGAASEVAVNLGKDAGTYRNVTLAVPGALDGTGNQAASFNGTSSYVELPKGTLKKSRDAAVELWFKIGLTQTGGPLIGYQDKAIGTAAGTGVPILYTGADGLLRGQFATGTVDPITSTVAVNNNQWHHVVLSMMGTTLTMYLDGQKVGEKTNHTVDHTPLTFNQIGAASATPPASWTGWGGTAQRYFAGVIDEVAVYSHPLGPAAAGAHYRYRAAALSQLSKVTLPSGKVVAEAEYDTDYGRIKEYTDGNGGTWKIGTPAVYGNDSDLRRSVQVLDPANRPYLYEYDALAGRMLRSGTPLGLEIREEDRPGAPSPSPNPSPSPTCSRPDPNDPGFCTIIPDNSGGPVFVRHPLEGMAIRSYFYDDKGQQNKVVNENGDAVEMTYDARGNLASRKTCRTATECYTTYYTYPAAPTNLYDARNDLATETRDGRSANATDANYVTRYEYHFTGQLSKQTNPDTSVVSHFYTNGAEVAVGGGNVPTGLPTRTVDANGKETRFAYYQNGDLARVTEPTGLITEYQYDALGRKTTETQKSDTFPNGVTTTYTYDSRGRAISVIGPVTTDAVTGAQHQLHVVNEYDDDGNIITLTANDTQDPAAQRITRTEYDEYNRPAKVTDAEGNETSYGYDRFGNKTSMVDANGVRYDYAYTAQNKIAEVRLRDWRGDPPGSPGTVTGDYLVLHSYSYDHAGRLASDTDAMGRRIEYQYYRDDLLHRTVLKGFHNPDGSTRDYVVTENGYDGAGNLVRTVEGNGKLTTQHTLDKAGKVSKTVVDPTGLARVNNFTYDGNGNVRTTSRSGKYSNVPWLVPANDAEQVAYEYDDGGNVKKETVTAGTATRITTYTYDRRGLLLTETDPRGNVTGADPAAYTTTYQYDELGRQTRATGPAVAAESNGQAPATVNPTVTTGYDAFGQTTSVRDELGNVSRTEYDRLGRPVRSIAPTYTAPGAGTAITPTASRTYDGMGNVVESTDPRGGATRYTYDQLNRVVVRDEPVTDNNERALWRYTYTRTGDVLSVTDPTGARSESTYDDLDRLATVTQVERRPVADNFTTRFTYDDLGNTTAVRAPSGATTLNVYNGVGDIIRTTSPAGVVTEFGYDFGGRQVRATDGLGRTVRTGYNLFGDRIADTSLAPDETPLRSQTYGYDAAGNLVSARDPYSVTTTYRYDAAGQLVEQVEPVDATTSITTTFGYDAAGNRTRYTDGRQNSTTYTFNSLGLPESIIEPSTVAHPAAGDRTWTVTYDGKANPVRLNAPGGVSRVRTYDLAGRLTTETGAGAAVATSQRDLRYDLAGRLVRASAPGGDNTYTYDDRGALLTTAGPSGTASFGYDRDGAVTSRTDAAGTGTFTYDRGRLNTLTDAATGVTQRLGYDASGAVKTVDYGAGRVRTFDYDNVGRQTGDTLRNGGGQAVASITYGFDLNGHLTSKKTAGTAGAGDNAYEYDRAGRLTAWTGPNGRVDYRWDGSGNRIGAGGKTATFDERNRLLSDGDYTYTYTPRGTLATRTSSGLTDTYTFDAFDRLVSGDGQSYTYDGLDRVLSRNGAAFAYAGLGDDVVSDGGERYARGPASELLAVASGQTSRLVLTDAHGDVIAGLDPAVTTPAQPAASKAYDPWGKPLAENGDTGNVGFQGDWTDPDTGHVDMGARWYNPGTGTFDSRDSVTYSAGDSILANRYTYGAGAPLDFADPDGNWPKWAKSIGNGLKTVAKVVSGPVGSFVSSHISSWATSAWNWGVSAYRATISFATKTFNTVKNAVVNKVREGWTALRTGNFKNWAKEQARIAHRKLQAAKAAVTAAARTAVKAAIKLTPLPALKAAAKPLLKLGSQLVSSSVKLAASVVQVSTLAIRDPDKFQQNLFLAAAQKWGGLVETVTAAADAVSEFAHEHATLVGAAVGIGVGLLCGVAIGWTGVGAVACGAIAGAVGSFVTGYLNGERGWDLVKTTAMGAAFGAVTGGLGSVGGAAIGAGVRAASTGLRSAGGAALRAGAREADNIAGGLSGGRLSLGTRARPSVARSAPDGCNSFTGSTAVLMADGRGKPIKDVRVGDEVLATDPTTGESGPRRVTALIVGEGEKQLVEVTVEARGLRGTVNATAGHPFWAPDLRRWVTAGELKVGTLLRTAAGTYVQVTAIKRWTSAKLRVHNLTVDTLHTYYVLAAQTPVLAHNDACDLSGEAIVHLDRGKRHASIEVTYQGKTIHSEQAGDIGTLAVGRFYEGEFSDVHIPIRFNLPNARRAQAFQTATEDYVFGAYDLETRSCVTYCLDVLRAGGVEGVPSPDLGWRRSTLWIFKHDN